MRRRPPFARSLRGGGPDTSHDLAAHRRRLGRR
jgi:hypothetical protein